MSADFPWGVLGLDGPGDEAQIRRAYARKLKATRPDEDPEGFQALVQAREIALGIASGAITLHRIDNTETAGVPEASGPDAAPAATANERNDGQSEAETGEDAPPVIVQFPAVAEPVEKPAEEELTLEKLRRHPAIWDMETWQEVADLLGQLPFTSRQRIEAELLYAIAQLDWEHVSRDKPFSAVLLTFSEEYGWEHDSVKLVSVFGNPAQASAFHELLCYVRDVAEGRRELGDGASPFATAQPVWQPDDEPPDSTSSYEEKDESGKVPWGAIVMVVIVLINLARCASMNTTRNYKYDTRPPPAQTIIEKQKKDVEFIREPLYRRPAAPGGPQ